MMEINREDERPDVVMTAKDKDDINMFSRHLARRHDLQSRIQGRKKLIQLHDDASDELILMDDDAGVFYNVGDVFILDDKEEIDSSLEETKTELHKDVEQYESELRTISDEMAKLKGRLYAKFGKVCSSSYSIQLYLFAEPFECILTHFSTCRLSISKNRVVPFWDLGNILFAHTSTVNPLESAP